MSGLPTYILDFLLLVGPLVLVHELGHYAVAKWCGVKVLRFSFGFGPRLIGFRVGETDYRLSLLPLGGYVKMAGDNPSEPLAEADRGRGFLEAAPWKRALIAVAGPAMNLVAPIAVFFALAMGGDHQTIAPVVGVVLPDSPAARAGMQPGDRIVAVDDVPVQAFEELRDRIGDRAGQTLRVKVEREGRRLDLAMVPAAFDESDEIETTHRAVIGIRPMPPPATIGVVDTRSPAYRAGLRTFDRVVEIGGEPISDGLALERALARRATGSGPLSLVAVRTRPLGFPGLGPALPEIVRASVPSEPVPSAALGIESSDLFVRWVVPGSAAAKAGIRVGDRLRTLNGAPIQSWWGFDESMKKEKEQPVTLEVQSPGQASRKVQLAASVLELGDSALTGSPIKLLGLGVLREGEALIPSERASPREWVFPPLPRVPLRLSWAQAAEKSVSTTVEIARKELLGIWRMIQGRISVKNLGGPLMIADVARQAAEDGLATFLFVMTLVSINLGLVNLFPMPALDGGHIATALIEGIRRKPLSQRAREVAGAFGLVLLLALMAFVILNDLVQHRGPSLFP
jgi:regulator of sigma E protease